MSKTVLKPLLALFGLTAVLYTLLLFWQNGTTMIVTMDTPQHTPLHPRVYFNTPGTAFSQEHSVEAYKIEKLRYHFSIPPLKTIDTLRFDPAVRDHTQITVKKITFLHSHWFRQTSYLQPLSDIRAGNQISNLTRDKKGIHFATTGNDPQLLFAPAPQMLSTRHNLHIDLFLIALLCAAIIVYLYFLYKTEEFDTRMQAKLILYVLFLSLALFKVVYYKDHVKFGYPPDEIAHLHYVQYVQEHHDFVPSFEKMPHYLSHPPLYYELIASAYDPLSTYRENLDHFRSRSILIYMAAFLLILYLGFSSSLGILGHFTYLSVVSSIPMHAYIGASLSNDTLAMLGGIVFILGLKRILEKRYDTSTYLLIALGAFLAFFSKLTAALLVFFAVVFLMIRMFFTKEWIKPTRTQWVILAVFILPILYYQVSVMLHYHALVPTYNVTHPEAYLKSGFYVPEANRLHLSPKEWFERMLHYIHGGWFGIHSHHSFGHASVTGFAGLLMLHLMAILALFVPCRRDEQTFCTIGKITLLSLFSVLVVQYLFSYKAHLAAGYMGGLQPRYLLPFMFAFAIMASIFVERFKKYFWFNIAVILICIQAIYSDFFYFLQYYR